MGSNLVNVVFNARNILLEQLEHCGYNVDNYKGFTTSEIHIMLKNKQLDMIVENNRQHKIFVKYYINKSIRPMNMYDIIENLYRIENILEPKTDQVIFITKDDPNDTLEKTMKQIWYNDHIYVRVRSLKRLQFNILKHSFVPPHRILDEEEAKHIYYRYNIKNPKTEMPTISRFDPVAITLGIKPGQLCEIKRKSPTSMISYYYRYCIQ